MRGASPASSPAPSTSSVPKLRYPSQGTDEDNVLHNVNEKEKEVARDASHLECTRICAVFAQATAVIEHVQLQMQGGDSADESAGSGFASKKGRTANDEDEETEVDIVTKRVEEAASLLPKCRVHMSTSLRETGNEIKWTEEREREKDSAQTQTQTPMQTKVGRALEKLRRVAVKWVDADAAPKESLERRGYVIDGGGGACMKRLLDGIVDVYEVSTGAGFIFHPLSFSHIILFVYFYVTSYSVSMMIISLLLLQYWIPSSYSRVRRSSLQIRRPMDRHTDT